MWLGGDSPRSFWVGAGSPSPPPPPQQQPQKPPSPPPARPKKTFIPDPSCFRAGLDLAFAAEASFPFPRRARGGVRAWCQNYASLAAPPEEEDNVKLFGLGPAPKPCMYVLHSLVLSRALISREEMKHI